MSKLIFEELPEFVKTFIALTDENDNTEYVDVKCYMSLDDNEIFVEEYEFDSFSFLSKEHPSYKNNFPIDLYKYVDFGTFCDYANEIIAEGNEYKMQILMFEFLKHCVEMEK